MGKNDTPREDLCRIDIFAYQNGFIVGTTPRCDVQDGVIFFSNKEYALGYDRYGNVLQYSVKIYKWRRIKNDAWHIKAVINYLKDHRDKYPGVHHINLYGGVSRKFKRQVPIPNWNI